MDARDVASLIMRVVSLACVAACSAPATHGIGTDAARRTTLDRAAEWVAAKVPYCQAANHQADADEDCAATCERPANPAWDAYRSDCAGYLSWAWDLPAPGRTTKQLAPFATELTHAIDASELRPGDAVNNADHALLFVAWTQPGGEATFMEETGCSSSKPYAIETTLPVTLSGTSITVAYHGAFTAIRYDRAP
jgi:hypothetical protein